MPERVDDRGAAGAVVLVGLPLHGGPTLPRPIQGGIGVGHVEHQAHRTRLWLGRFQTKLGILVGQVEHAVTDLQLRVPDAAVVHLVHVAHERRTEGVDVPGDGVSCVGDGQIGQRRGTRGCGRHLGLGGGLGQLCDGGIGAAHVDSFCSIRQGQRRLQACAESSRERRIGLDRKLVAMQHGQRIVAVVHDMPPSGPG